MEVLLEVQMLPPDSIQEQKKKSLPKFEGVLSPNSIEDPKKRRSSPQFGAIFGRNLRFIGADCHCFV